MKERTEGRRTLDDGNSLQLRAWLKLCQATVMLKSTEVGIAEKNRENDDTLPRGWRVFSPRGRREYFMPLLAMMKISRNLHRNTNLDRFLNMAIPWSHGIPTRKGFIHASHHSVAAKADRTVAPVDRSFVLHPLLAGNSKGDEERSNRLFTTRVRKTVLMS